jgi:hypothetical protein
VIPADGIEAGAIFGYGQDNFPFVEQWQPSSGNFSLDSDIGDNLFMYCINADDLPHFITGYSYAGPFMNASDFAGLDMINQTQFTVLPDRLMELGNVALPFVRNYFFNVSLAPTDEGLIPKAEQQQLLQDPANYAGSDVAFRIPDETSGARMTIQSLWTIMLLTAAIGILW